MWAPKQAAGKSPRLPDQDPNDREMGYIFRLVLGYLHEIALTKTVVTPEGMRRMADNDKSRALERQLVAEPKLTSTLHGLQQQHSSLSVCVRLSKRWVAAHMLLGEHMVPEEAVELVCAHLYLQPAPYMPPGTPLVGFLRFLHLMCSHDWKTAPLVVNLNSELTKEDYNEIRSHFTRDRATLPLMYIATPTHKLTSLWTRHAPSAPILQRTALLAKETLVVLEEQLEADRLRDANFKSVFQPLLDPYDVVIHLRPSMLARRHQALDAGPETAIFAHEAGYKQGSKASSKVILPVIDFDPVQIYLKELREAFSDVALFFHDCYGGSVIGVLWKPQALEPHEFKTSHVNCRTLEVGVSEPQLVLNIPAILEDFKVLGQGIVKLIERRT